MKESYGKAKNGFSTIFASLIIVFLFMAVMGNVIAQDLEKDDIKKFDFPERMVGIHVGQRWAHIESIAVREEGRDFFEVTVEAGESINIWMNYRKQADELTSDIRFLVRFMEIIEFEDINHNDIIDHEDKEVSNYRLIEREYKPLLYSYSSISGGITKHVLTIESKDGVFKVVLHIVGRTADFEFGKIGPNEVKIDLIIENYVFVQDNTKLALLTHVITPHIIDRRERSWEAERGFALKDEEEIQFEKNGERGFFSWSKVAVVDHVEMPVHSTVLEDEGTFELGDMLSKVKSIFFVYPRGNIIIHDPKVGVLTPHILGLFEPITQTKGDIVFYSMAMVTAIGLVATTYQVRKRLLRT